MGAEAIHHQEAVFVKPSIYELIEQEAGCEAVAQQMYTDYFATRDNERVLLGLRNLQSRGPEGAAYIRMISNGSDELSQLVKRIQDDGLEGEQVEEVLGVHRFKGEIVDQCGNEEAKRIKALSYFKEKLGFTGDLEGVFKIQERDFQLGENARVPILLTGRVEETTFNAENVFGAEEPTYLEMLGPEEILRLRSMEEPSMLLLGSLGKYSARGFRSMADKINPQTETTVIDISDVCIDLIKNDTDNRNIAVEGDVRDLPFPENFMDHVYTNSLFHYMLKDENLDIDSLQSVFNEAYRVLKPKGSFLISEFPFGGLEGEPLEDRIKIFARTAGFSNIILSRNTCSYVLWKENSSTVIDNNGFPKYDGLLNRKSGTYMDFRFIK